MCPSGVMFPSEVMCASRVRMRNTSHHFATKGSKTSLWRSHNITAACRNITLYKQSNLCYNITESEVLLGYYISLVWYCDTLAFFKDRVESQCSLSTPEYKSLMLYIQGYELWQNNDVAGAIAKLKESISAFSGHVHNYILLARLCGNNASMCLIEVARSNIHVRNIFNDIAGYVNPNNYIDEFISGRLMPMDTFNAIVSQMKH